MFVACLWSRKGHRMKHFQAQKSQTISRRLWTTSIAVLTGACLALLPQWLYAHEITPPPVPSELEVPAGHRPFLLGHATGTQNYMCIPSAPALSGPLSGRRPPCSTTMAGKSPLIF